MKYLKKQYLMGLSIVLLFNACDSFVEVDLPKSQLTRTTVFDTYETSNAALVDIYKKMRDTGILTGTYSGISNQMGNYTDELVAYGNPSNPSMAFYNNAILATTTNIADYWNATYNQIYAANAVLKGTQISSSLSADTKKQLQGEAYFIRAISHFYLVNLFGDIPYIKETAYVKNSTVKRIATGKVYENIIVDLQNAVSILPDTYSTSERIRPNKFTCKALLARVYLYTKSYAEAANEASAVLNQTDLYALEQNLDAVFLINSKETIWQLQSGIAGQNTQEGAFFIFDAGPPSTVSLNPTLVNSFANTDLRKSKWIMPITDGTSFWYHAYKYKEVTNTVVSQEYSVVFRLAEQYLIRAEARAQQGDLIGAKEDLTIIRLRAGLNPTTATSQLEIMEALVQERKWELFTELGHRFFDLKRLDQLDLAFLGIKLGWNTSDNLLPIPQTELSANPYLRPQNPGY